MMRKLLLLFAVMSAMSLARAADTAALVTNSVSFGEHGTLEVLIPKDWTLLRTNLNLPRKPESFELHSARNEIVVRITSFWDGFGGSNAKPTEEDMANSVRTNAERVWLPISVEKSLTVEKLRGPAVTGSFVRITDAKWVPVVKGTYRNQATGMFRSGNLWGSFDLLTNDKDGPEFKQGLNVMESLRRKP